MSITVPIIESRSSDITFPSELWDVICSVLPKPSLSRLRLVCRGLNSIALPWTFRELRFEGFGNSTKNFVEIAKSPQLRHLVRELTVDTSVELDFEYNCNEDYQFPTEFLDALPYINCFKHLDALHLRFNHFCGDEDRTGISIEETWDFRYRVLDTVCHCIAGMWTVERQMEIEDAVDDSPRDYKRTYPEDEFDDSDQVIQLKELTITNLADFHDPRLASSEAFKRVVSLASLRDLKILITSQKDEDLDNSTVYYEEKYKFFKHLPRTWLNTNISNNLTTLSLYSEEFWGWFPKMDFRSMDFPNLQVLALGHYVFTHDWQIDWMSSIGQKNGVGGLRELYLDNCPILYQANQASPLDENDPGYPVVSTVFRAAAEMHTYPIRWSDVLSRWATSMKSLEVFRMGHSHWFVDEAPEDTLESVLNHLGTDADDEGVLRHRLSNNVHRSFDCPEPIDRAYGDVDPQTEYKSGKYLRGTGINGRYGGKLQYIEYDVNCFPSPWKETFWSYRDDNEGFEPEDGAWTTDIAALQEFTLAVKARTAGN
ncbi:hypothetical protein FHETE_9066 [Fusarium heterosporum]|uniref:F-box domain-containing protein n=1 Tax=Fusarium heterosporum TaxID=42747 RepID=A0A8H5WIU3_FUSHE|nr:hypothetical protein FHETE_9066 [Fusarium heterosporum]